MYTFFDYFALSPKEEILNAFNRTDAENLDSFGSLKGRAVCLLKVGQHTAGIVLKPLYYLYIGTLGSCLASASFWTANSLARADMTEEAQENFRKNEHYLYVDNPDLRDRKISLYSNLIGVAPAAFVSQIIQVVKAALGVLHPGIYFRKDELSPQLYRLAAVAKHVGCEEDLVKELKKGSSALALSENKQYLIAEYTCDLKIIAEKLEDPWIPDSRKLSVLSMLNPDEQSGIKGCGAGLGRILKQMRKNLDVPENPGEIVPYLRTRLKDVVVNMMVQEVEHDVGKRDLPRWKTALIKLGDEPAHQGAALIATIGKDLDLPEDSIARTALDPLAKGVQISSEDREALIEEFKKRYSRQNQIDYLQAEINSEMYGSPGLRTFREQIIQALSSSVTQEMLNEANAKYEAVYVIERYQINRGDGDMSDPGYNDLNREAMEALLDNPNLFIPNGRD